MSEQPTKGKSTTFWVLSLLMGLSFLAAGFAKFGGVEQIVQNFIRWGYPVWFRMFVGVAEIVAGTAILIPRTRFYGAALATGLMVGGLGTHLRFGEVAESVPALVLGVICAILAWRDRPMFLRPARA
jgi:putative oxidoreductase